MRIYFALDHAGAYRPLMDWDLWPGRVAHMVLKPVVTLSVETRRFVEALNRISQRLGYEMAT